MQWIRTHRLRFGCGVLLLAAVSFVAWAVRQGEQYWDCKLDQVLCFVSDRPDLTNDTGRRSFWGAVQHANSYLELAAGLNPSAAEDVRIAWVRPGRTHTIIIRFSVRPERAAKIAERGIPFAREDLNSFLSFLSTGTYGAPLGDDGLIVQDLAYLPGYPFSRLRWWPPKADHPDDLEPYVVTVPEVKSVGSSNWRWAGVMVVDRSAGRVWIAGRYLAKPGIEAMPPDPEPSSRSEPPPAPPATSATSPASSGITDD